MFLTVLSITHTWDWEVHALYARLLGDAGQATASWHTALVSIFLNPAPDVEDFKFLAFIGKVTGLGRWPEIQEAIRLASVDEKTAARAIAESSQFFSPTTRSEVVPPKVSHP
jgi:hypothetical protein